MKLYLKITIGFAIALLALVLFFFFQNIKNQNYIEKQIAMSERINRQVKLNLDSQLIQSLDEKINNIEKYVAVSQKNIDMWLKILTFILSVLIGISVFNGLRMQERAREELDKVKKMAEEATTKLTNANDQIKEIEVAAESAKKINNDMKVLSELGNKLDPDKELNEATLKKLQDSINRAQVNIQTGGIEGLKNIYFGKGLKAKSSKNWEEVIRLFSMYIDLDETKSDAYFYRGFAYHNEGKGLTIRKEINEKAFEDYNIAISLNPEHYNAYVNRGLLYDIFKKQPAESMSDFNKAIELKPNAYAAYLYRSRLYKKLGDKANAEKDLQLVKKLDPVIYEAITKKENIVKKVKPITTSPIAIKK